MVYRCSKTFNTHGDNNRMKQNPVMQYLALSSCSLTNSGWSKYIVKNEICSHLTGEGSLVPFSRLEGIQPWTTLSPYSCQQT